MICSPEMLLPEPKHTPYKPPLPSPLHPDNPTPHPAKEHVEKRKLKHTNNPNAPPPHKPSA